MSHTVKDISKDFLERMNLQHGKDVSSRCYIMKRKDGQILTLLAPELVTDKELQELKTTGFKLIKPVLNS